MFSVCSGPTLGAKILVLLCLRLNIPHSSINYLKVQINASNTLCQKITELNHPEIKFVFSKLKLCPLSLECFNVNR